jgi:hypothetical protein
MYKEMEERGLQEVNRLWKTESGIVNLILKLEERIEK